MQAIILLQLGKVLLSSLTTRFHASVFYYDLTADYISFCWLPFSAFSLHFLSLRFWYKRIRGIFSMPRLASLLRWPTYTIRLCTFAAFSEFLAAARDFQRSFAREIRLYAAAYFALPAMTCSIIYTYSEPSVILMLIFGQSLSNRAKASRRRCTRHFAAYAMTKYLYDEGISFFRYFSSWSLLILSIFRSWLYRRHYYISVCDIIFRAALPRQRFRSIPWYFCLEAAFIPHYDYILLGKTYQ